MRGGVPFGRGMLFALLSNRIYLGEVVHKGVSHPGKHAALIERPLWDAVQQLIADNRVSRKERRNARAPSLLAGILIDQHGRRMSPSHAVKSGKRYRYYVTQAAELVADRPPACRLPAHDIEAAVVAQLRKLLTDRSAIAKLGNGDAKISAAMIEMAAASAAKLATSYGRRSIVMRLVSLVCLDDTQISISIDRAALLLMLGTEGEADTSPLVLTAPAIRVRHGKDVKLVLAGQDGSVAIADRSLVDLLAEARAAREAVFAAPASSIKDIAGSIGQCRSRMARLIRLSWLAPDLVEAIVNGRHPPNLTPRKLLVTDLPLCWDEQKALLGFAEPPPSCSLDIGLLRLKASSRPDSHKIDVC